MPLRQLDRSQLANITPTGVTQEQGVSNFERFTVKNFASNPRVARAFLEKQGYEVRPYGSGLNFAVRRSAEMPWQVVDPKGLDFGDIFDLMSDLVQGGVVGAATVAAGAASGGLAAAGAGAAAGVGTEAVRQGIGGLLGVPDNLDTTSLALQGGVGAVAPALGNAAKATLRGLSTVVPKAGELAAEVGAKIAGFGSTAEALPAKRVLLEGAKLLTRSKAAGRRGLRSTGITTRQLRNIVDDATNPRTARFPESTILEEGLAEMDRPFLLSQPLGKMNKIATINFADDLVRGRNKDIVRLIQRANASGETNFIDNVVDEASALNNFMMGELGISPTNRVTLLQANAIRKHLQRRAADAGAFKFRAGGAHKDATQKFLLEQQKNVSSAIKDMTDDVLFRSYEIETGQQMLLSPRQLLGKIEEKTFWSQQVRNAMGIGDNSSKAIKSAENFITGVFGRIDGADIQMLQNFDRLFGTTMEVRALEANIAEIIGESGIPRMLPRFTAFGSFIGPSLVGSTLGIATGNPLIGLAGGLAASPKSIIGMAQLSQRFGPQFIGALGAGGEAAVGRKSITLANLLMSQVERNARASGGKSVSRQDPRRPRPTILVGQ